MHSVDSVCTCNKQRIQHTTKYEQSNPLLRIVIVRWIVTRYIAMRRETQNSSTCRWKRQESTNCPSSHSGAKVHRAVQYWHKGTSRRMDCLMGCTSFEHYRETVWIYSVPKACAHVKGCFKQISSCEVGTYQNVLKCKRVR